MRIRHRLLLGFMAVVAIFVIFGGYVLFVWQSMNRDMRTLEELFDTTVAEGTQRLDHVLRMGLSLEATRGTLLEAVLGRADARVRMEGHLDAFDDRYRALASSLRDSGDDTSLAALGVIEAQHRELRREATALAGDVVTGNRVAAVQVLEDRVYDEFHTVNGELRTLEDRVEAQTASLSQTFDGVLHDVEARIRALQYVMLAVFAVAILVAFYIGYVTARAISVPIEQLGRAAQRIETGDFEAAELAAVTARKDELGRFARIFDRMAAEIHRREEALRARIGTLRVEIDRKKSRDQVAEITETDFFKELQVKAKAMRTNRP